MKKAEWYEGKEGKAEHLVYLNSKEKELEKLLNGSKTMIIRGAAGKKCPLGGRAKINDTIYFVETGGNMMVSYKGIISYVDEDYKMTPEESIKFLKKYDKQLNLSEKQYEKWSSKKCLAVYEISNINKIVPFKYNREKNMDDWIITDNINKLK
ncbi:MAG TPA: hypothetical protein PLX66_03015 [Bacilli bacterium]|nr:hypothetical protein [Bacilli bacterium]